MSESPDNSNIQLTHAEQFFQDELERRQAIPVYAESTGITTLAPIAPRAEKSPALTSLLVVGLVAIAGVILIGSPFAITQLSLDTAQRPVALTTTGASQTTFMTNFRVSPPNLENVAKILRFNSSVVVTVTSNALVLRVEEFGGSEEENLRAFLSRLHFTPGVAERMERTQAVDGPQTATGEAVSATWTYDPDRGFEINIESDYEPSS